jgi:hypothetical protein
MQQVTPMITSHWATVRDGQVELVGAVPLPEGAKLLVTIFSDDEERSFWYKAQELSMKSVWDNPEDDVYAELLKK